MNGTKSILREPVTAKAGQGEQQCQGETKKDPESQPGVYSLGGYSGGKGGAAQLTTKRKRRDFVPVANYCFSRRSGTKSSVVNGHF